MSLRFDTNRCPDGLMKPDGDCTEAELQEQSWITPIVFTMMHTGIGRYTDDNLDEFLFRLRMWELAGFGVSYQPVPTEMVRRWRGISTNVSPWTRAKFMNHWRREVEREVDRKVKRELQSQTAAQSEGTER